MDPQHAADELRTIRELMERPIRYSDDERAVGHPGRAGRPGRGAGRQFHLRPIQPGDGLPGQQPGLAGAFLTPPASTLALTRIREKRQGLAGWSSVKRRILLTILPPFVAGVGLTCAIVYRWSGHDGPNQWGLIPAIWMGFYGVALWQVGEFSIAPLRVMGAAFVLAALATAAFWQAWPVRAAGRHVRRSSTSFTACISGIVTAGDAGTHVAMDQRLPHDRLDETIHQRTRMAIMALLAAVDALDFGELKSLLALTDGNLFTHLTALEKVGYVTIKKSFRGRKPNTSVRMTRQGRAALAEYVDLLRQILEPPGR